MTFDIGTAVTRTGKVGTDNSANFPKIFKDSVINDFLRACIIKDRHTIKKGEGQSITITSQGAATAKSRKRTDLNTPYQPTERILGNRTISREDMRYTMIRIADWDKVQQVPDYMDSLSWDLGSALARQWDAALLIQIMKGATTASSTLNTTFDGGVDITLPGAVGSSPATTSANVTGPQLVKATAQLSAAFDETELDASISRYLTLTPTNHSKMLIDKNDTVQNVADTRVGGVGNVADGNLTKVSQMMLIPSTLISEVAKNIAANDPDWGNLGTAGVNQQWENTMSGNYAKVATAAWTTEGVATAIWQDFGVKVRGEGEDSFTDVMGAGFGLAKMMYGCKFLRESCCGVILYP